MGTPSYMAPEQAGSLAFGRRIEVGPASDVYSLGAIFYHMLTGRPPFQAATPVETIMLALEHDPISPRALNPRVSPDAEMIALKCLQKSPVLRYADGDRRWPRTSRPFSGAIPSRRGRRASVRWRPG